MNKTCKLTHTIKIIYVILISLTLTDNFEILAIRFDFYHIWFEIYFRKERVNE